MLATLLLAGLPMGQSTLAAPPRPRPALVVQGDAGNGVMGSCVIPDAPVGSTALRMRAVYTYLALAGGQNRSGAAHPGFQFAGGTSVGVHHYWSGNNGEAVLPGLSAWRAIAVEWGPTQPAEPSEWIDPEEWPDRCDQDPTCYWGPEAFNPNVPRVAVVDALIPMDSSWWSIAPGKQVHLLTEGDWNVASWDGSHAWPYRVKWEESVVLYLSWE